MSQETTNKVRNILQNHISEFESKIHINALVTFDAVKKGNVGAIEALPNNLQELTQGLANLYLEYAFVSQGEETILYTLKAADLDPDVSVNKKLILPNPNIFTFNLNNDETSLSGTISQYLATERTPAEMKILENFLQGMKQELNDKGQAVLEKSQTTHQMIQDGEIPDQHVYAAGLEALSDDDLDEERRKAYQEDGVGSFVKEFRIEAEENRRTKERWKKGSRLPQLSFDQLRNIFSTDYPQQVIIHEEAVGGIKLGESRRFDSIDEICDRICLELSKRLPRRLDAYRFRQDETGDEIEIEGIGTVKVELSQTGNGIFTYIATIESDSFAIRNSRRSGRRFLNRYYDTALPNNVKIKPEDIEITLYSDDSGIFVKTQGLEYSNARIHCFGRGHRDDSHKDTLYPTRKGLDETTSKDILAFLEEKKKGKKEGVFRRRMPLSTHDLTRDPEGYASFIEELGRPFTLSWNQVSTNSAKWLADHVLNKILATPEYDGQATALPEAVDFPPGIGTLYTWMPAKNAEKLELTKGDPSKVYLNERSAHSPCYRLCPLGTAGDFPRKAYDGFMWCGIGEVTPHSSADKYNIPGHCMDSNDFGDYHNKLIEITPKNGEEIFVVDYKVSDDYKEQAFKENLRHMCWGMVEDTRLDEFVERIDDIIMGRSKDSVIFGKDWSEQASKLKWKLQLTDAQVDEAKTLLANTLVSITQYNHDYQKPVVLISRDLAFDEVSIVPGVEYNPRKNRR